jgi:F-type H+-transporting ATPase subunit b
MKIFHGIYTANFFAAMLALILLAAVVQRAEGASNTLPATGGAAPSQPDSSAVKGENKEKEVNPLEFKTDLALWTAVVFVVLFILLWRFAWGPLAEGLDKRERHIADQIAQAHEANQKAKDLLAAYEKKLADTQDEVRAILEKARRDSEQVGRAMIDKAKADARAEGERMLKQIDAATTSALKELADRSASLAVELAGKIVRAKLNPKDHAKLIEQAVAGFAEGKSGASRN